MSAPPMLRQIANPSPPRIICGDCMRDAEVLWSERRTSWRAWAAHIRCHGVDRLVAIDDRITEEHAQLLWSQLRDMPPNVADLERTIEEEERELVATAARIQAMQTVLRSRISQGDDQ